MSLRLAFMGTPDFAVPALDAILSAGHQVAAVFSKPPSAAGRGLPERLSAVHRFAQERGLPVRTPASLRTIAERDAFPELAVEAVVVVAYGLMLPKTMIAAPPFGCINIHASLLPRWRGAAPIARAIMEGDRETGVTIMRMDEGLDTGPVGFARKVPIEEGATAGDLHDRLSRLGAEVLLETLAGIERGSAEWRPQAATGVTYARKIEKSETHIAFDQSADRVLHHIHGLSPDPGAWTVLRREEDRHRLKILKAERLRGEGIPGAVIDDDFSIACVGGAVRPLVIQREGKSPLPRAEFLRGLKIAKGERLE